MRQIVRRILHRYTEKDWLLQRKAKILLMLHVLGIVFLISEICISSWILGYLAPEFFPNLVISLGLFIALILLYYGHYNVAIGISIFISITGISWTRYASTGHYSTDASYDFIQYVTDLIVILFYTNLISYRRIVLIVTFLGSIILLILYSVLLPHFFSNTFLPVTQSVYFSGYIFLIISGLIALYSFQQNQKAIEVAKAESESSKRNEQRYREIFNSTSEAIALFDASTLRIVDVNDVLINMFGLNSKEEALRASIGEFSENIPPYTMNDAILYIKNAQKFGPQTLEWRAKKKNGETFWIEISIKSSDIAGQDRIIAVIRDATDRKRTEDALHTSEELYRKLITAIPDIIVRTDLEGNILFINESTFPAFGYTTNQRFLGKNLISFIAEKDKQRALENIKKMLEQKLEPQEYTFVSEEGAIIECDISGDVLRQNDGTPYGLVFLIRDLTDKKKMQDHLLQSQKMEAIGRLAGGVAHDYNNMLGVILGYAFMVERELTPTHPAHSKIKSIITAAERSANLTKQLLAFARQQIIAPVALNLNDELEGLKKLLDRLIGEDIKLIIHREENLWKIKIDPTQLTQVITNLATNARDAIENVGTITITTTNVVVDEVMASKQVGVSPGEYIMLTFQDSGVGMDSNTVAQIFEPFFTTKSKGKRTGLGLATVFGIINQNDGFITVSSEIGNGTTFKLYFHRFFGDTTIKEEKEEESSLEGKEAILIVEDEEALLTSSKYVLEMKGYKVFSASSPMDALAVVEKYYGTIDLLITDVVMPGINGKELKVHLEKKYPDMRTLFISGYTADVVAKRGIIEEGIHFLEKPFSPKTLSKKVKEVLEGS